MGVLVSSGENIRNDFLVGSNGRNIEKSIFRPISTNPTEPDGFLPHIYVRTQFLVLSNFIQREYE